MVNPDLDRVPVDPEPNIAASGWSRDRLDRDPAKKAYVERARAFAEQYRLKLLAALGQTTPISAEPEAPLPPIGGKVTRT